MPQRAPWFSFPLLLQQINRLTFPGILPYCRMDQTQLLDWDEESDPADPSDGAGDAKESPKPVGRLHLLSSKYGPEKGKIAPVVYSINSHLFFSPWQLDCLI